MRQYARSIVIFVVLLAMILLSFKWQQILVTSIINFVPPLAGNDFVTAENVLLGQSDKVVLVIISGLGNQAKQGLSMPNLTRLEETGAVATTLSSPPAYRMPVWTSLISGAPPAFSGMPLLPQWDDNARPITVDSLFNQAQAQGVKVVVAGQPEWKYLLSETQTDDSFFTSLENQQGDEQLMDFLSHTLDSSQKELWLVQFNQFEAIARTGSESAGYEQAITHIDMLLAELLNILDLNNTTLIITADYGHIENGGAGGPDPAVIEQPLVLAGQGVVSGAYSSVSQVDIAPTIAILLGLNIPAQNQGRPLLEMLQIPSSDRAEILVALARQQIALTSAFFKANNLVIDDSINIETAQNFLQNKNYDGAAQLADLLTAQSKADFRAAQEGLSRQSQLVRAVTALVLILVAIIWFIKQRSSLWIEAGISGLMIVAMYHILYLASRNPYSFSAILNFEQFEANLVQRLGLSILTGVTIFLFLLLLRQQSATHIVLHSSYEMILTGVAGFFALAIYGFVVIGPTINGLFPDITVLFHYVTSLSQTLWFSAGGLFVPPIVVLLNMLFQGIIYGLFLRKRLVTTEQQKK